MVLQDLKCKYRWSHRFCICGFASLQMLNPWIVPLTTSWAWPEPCSSHGTILEVFWASERPHATAHSLSVTQNATQSLFFFWGGGDYQFLETKKAWLLWDSEWPWVRPDQSSAPVWSSSGPGKLQFLVSTAVWGMEPLPIRRLHLYEFVLHTAKVRTWVQNLKTVLDVTKLEWEDCKWCFLHGNVAVNQNVPNSAHGLLGSLALAHGSKCRKTQEPIL